MTAKLPWLQKSMPGTRPSTQTISPCETEAAEATLSWSASCSATEIIGI